MSEATKRVMLVTGALGAVGSCVMRSAHAAGFDVIGTDIRADSNCLACDVTDEADVAALFRRLNGLTDVVHAAGVALVGPLSRTAIPQVEHVLRVNLLGSFVVSQAATRALRRGGTLTLVASQAATHGSPGWSAYCASKAGVVRLVESLAKEVGPNGIRVNAVSPGSVESPMIDDLAADLASAESSTPADVLQRYRDENPLRRMARPEDVAEACMFLTSEAAGYINGANLAVDGGDRPG